jgi:hypothetical protein
MIKPKHMKTIIYSLALFLLSLQAGLVSGQGVAINETGAAAHTSSMLDIQSTTKGVLIPKMTTAQRTSIASPAVGLLVFDTVTESFWFNSSTGWVELADATSNPWQTSGSNIYFNTGNVGIGDATPAADLTVGNGDKFQVESTRGNMTFTDDSASIKFPSTTSLNRPMIFLFASGTQNRDRMIFGHSPSFPTWGIEYNDTSDVFHFRSSAARKFSFELASGDLGIGLENPGFPLDVLGRMRLRSDGTTSRPGIWFSNQDNTFDRAFFGMSEPDSVIGIWSQHLGKWAIEFEVMREPRIGINISAGSPPRAELHVVHTNFGGSNDGVRIQNEGTNLHYWNLYTSNTTGDFEFFKSGIKRATIDPSSGAYTAVSDARFKENISDLSNVMPSVMKLQPKTYQMKDAVSDRYFTGLLAQELEQIFPQFVYYGGDDQVTYSVDYAGLSVIALKAIQEQQIQIEALKKELEELKSAVSSQQSAVPK